MIPAALDTGGLVSGIFWRHEPHQCVQAWLRGHLALMVLDYIFAEYERVLCEVKAGRQFVSATAGDREKSGCLFRASPARRPNLVCCST